MSQKLFRFACYQEMDDVHKFISKQAGGHYAMIPPLSPFANMLGKRLKFIYVLHDPCVYCLQYIFILVLVMIFELVVGCTVAVFKDDVSSVLYNILGGSHLCRLLLGNTASPALEGMLGLTQWVNYQIEGVGIRFWSVLWPHPHHLSAYLQITTSSQIFLCPTGFKETQEGDVIE